MKRPRREGAARASANALLLAAGPGTRLLPLTTLLPKCLMPICGKPLLGYWLQMLDGPGFGNVVVNLHHHADLVRRFVEEGPHATKVKLVYEEHLLGTGGTLLANRSLLEGQAILVAHADNLSVFDPTAMLHHHARRPKGCVMTMMVFRAPDPGSCGVVELDKRRVVQAFHEKVETPPGNLANGAVYVFDKAVFGELADLRQEAIDLSTEVLPRMIGRAYCVENRQLHRDIGTLKSLVAAQFEMSMLFPDLMNRVDDTSWRRLLQAGTPPLNQQLVSLIAECMESDMDAPADRHPESRRRHSGR